MNTEGGTKENPWQLKTAPGTASYEMYIEGDLLICQVGATMLSYLAPCIEDLVQHLKEKGDWVELGAADEQKEPKPDTIEAWGPLGNKPGRRMVRPKERFSGSFRHVRSTSLGLLGHIELEHNPKNNRARAK